MNDFVRNGLAAVFTASLSWSPAWAEEASVSNMSVLGPVRAGTPLVAGFTIPAGPEKTVLIRVAGPALSALGVREALLDPKLDLYNGAGINLAENDNFAADDAGVATSVGAFPFAPGGKDAILVTSLKPGTYTAQASGVDDTAGLALVEIYDLCRTGSRLSHLSTLTQLRAADDLAVAGFTVAPGPGARRFLIRAVGAARRAFDVVSPLADPKLEVFAGSEPIAENDNWSKADAAPDDVFIALSAAFADTGAFPLVAGSSDSALLVDLLAGSYSIQVRSANGSGGAVLIEAYEVPPNTNVADTRSLANLMVKQFTVVGSSDGYFRWYSPRLQLIETTGRGGAVVLLIELVLEGTPLFGSWNMRMPVTAGGSFSALGADPNSISLGSFGIEGGPMPANRMTATITYQVSDGTKRVVTVGATISN